MQTQILVTNLILVTQLALGANLDSPFAIDPEELQLKEISDNVRRVSGAVMGLAEYVLDIRADLRSIRADIVDSRALNTQNITAPTNFYPRPNRDPEHVRRQSLELADKVEKLLAMEQSPEVDLAKEELKKTVEKNFLRMLAAILVTGPAHTQERAEDIFKLMRSVLNGELDFNPVVQRLPLILRDSETNQFVNLLITLRESERGSSSGFFRQGLINSVDTSAQNSNVRPVYNNFPNNQYYNPVQTPPQYIPGSGPYVNHVPTNNNIVPPGGNVGSNIYNSNMPSNLQGVGAQSSISTQTQSPNAGTSSQLPSINSILDAMNQTNQLIKEIPSLVEGLQTLVESLEGLFG